MNIAFLTKSIDKESGGLLPVMQQLAYHLNPHGVNVTSIGVKQNEDLQDDLGWYQMNVARYPCVGPKSFGYSPSLKRGLVEVNPEITHVHGLFYYTSIVSCNWGMKENRPYLVSPHGMLDTWVLNQSKIKKKIAKLIFEYRHLKYASCLHSLCTSETTAIRKYGIKNTIFEIPNGVQLPRSYEYSSPPWADTFTKPKKILLFLGRIHPKKGLNNLIEAWADLAKNNSTQEWVICIIGWGNDLYQEELTKRIKELGMQDWIFLWGPKFGEEKESCYHNADAFILPSFSEGLPMAVLEAWSHKLPVLITENCNLPEGIKCGAANKVSTKKEQLKTELLDFIRLNDTDRKSMGENGYKLVCSKFNWEKISYNFYKVYQWMLGHENIPSFRV